MTNITRRSLVLNGLLTVIAGSCCSLHARAVPSRRHGCWLTPEEAKPHVSTVKEATIVRSMRARIEPRSGNRELDKALVQSLARLTGMLGILPGFAYFDDASGPNAFATTERILGNTDGSVLFGLKLLEMCLKRPTHGDASIVAICAHEYGHILSYKNGMMDKLSPANSGDEGTFRAEQFADFVAGYYAGTRKRANPSYPAVAFATTQLSFGGGDHGTGEQRGEAVQEGFLAAYDKGLAPEPAFERGLEFSIGRRLFN
jgi:hypothetical protein